MTALLQRGPEFVYLARDGRSGVFELTHPEPAPRGLYALWEGALRYLHHACGVEGGVGPTRISPSGRSGVIHVSWEPAGADRDAWLG